MANRAVRKRLSYRDFTGASQEAHQAHWAGFRWSTGPVIVTSRGPWGLVRVLAASASEGQRVIRHAAAIGGWDADDPEVGEWEIQATTFSRNGRRAEVGVRVREGIPSVTKRDGPSGAPLK
jgi:hypothetical protein